MKRTHLNCPMQGSESDICFKLIAIRCIPYLPFSDHPPDMNAQPEPAAHSPFTKRQPYQSTSVLDAFLPPSVSSSLPPQSTPSSLMAPPVSSLPKMAVPPLGQQVSPSSPDAQGSSPLPLQQHKLKQQKKRTSITTKVTAQP